MQYRKLGRTDIEVSTIAMGCWAIVGDSTWGAQDESDSIAALEACFDAGINFFDTAEAYGDGYSEEMIGKVTAGRRDKAVIATKPRGNRMSREELIKSCEESLRRLQTDYIDLYQLHWPSRTVPMEETMEAVYQLQKQGKIRAAGVCNFGPQDLKGMLEIGRVESNQLAYNLIFRALEHESRQQCLDEDIGILCYSPIAQGLLTGKYAKADDVPEGRARTRHFSKNRPQARHTEEGRETETFESLRAIRGIADELHVSMGNLSLAWLLHQPAVTSVLASARNPMQLRENAEAADLYLSDEVLDSLSGVTHNLKNKLGPNMDMWDTESRIR